MQSILSFISEVTQQVDFVRMSSADNAEYQVIN